MGKCEGGARGVGRAQGAGGGFGARRSAPSPCSSAASARFSKPERGRGLQARRPLLLSPLRGAPGSGLGSLGPPEATLALLRGSGPDVQSTIPFITDIKYSFKYQTAIKAREFRDESVQVSMAPITDLRARSSRRPGSERPDSGKRIICTHQVWRHWSTNRNLHTEDQ